MDSKEEHDEQARSIGLELETMSWVHWFNDQRLHSHCNHTPPTEFEQAFYAAQTPTPTGVGNQ